MSCGQEKEVHPVDTHVGERIRLRRKELGISQERLAEILGITFQQVQKYERGFNRISASRLWDVARACKTTPSYYYEGLASEDAEPVAMTATDVRQHINILLSGCAQHLKDSLFGIVQELRRRRA